MQSKYCVNWLIICLITSPVVLIAWRPPRNSPPFPQNDPPTRINTYPVFSPALNPTRNHDAKRGTDYVFQIPHSPLAVLFLAHGCGRTARVFWDRHSGCPTCLGFPEERAFVIAALGRGFAVIAISSAYVCWNVKEDLHNVGEILPEWIARSGVERLPVVALGASTGGWFVSRFANQFRFHAIVLMVAEGRFCKERLEFMPPVMFVHMVKDVARVQQIRADMAVLTASGVSVREHLCMEFPVLRDFFARCIPYIDNDTSALMVEKLVANGSLTEERLLKNDARWFDWSLPLEANDLLPADLRAHVEEELNVAFAFHEFSSLAAPEVFQWFDYHIQGSSFVGPA